MAVLKGGDIVGRVLKEEGVAQYFGIHGGHVWGLLNGAAASGVRMMHFRHEQSAAYAADGWAKATRQPGVCFATAGPGMYNLVPGIAHAYHSESPVVALVGQHATIQDHWQPFQEGYAEPIFSSITKWTKRIVDVRTIGYFLRTAFRDAATYPPGPVVLELPVNVLDEKRDESEQYGLLPKGAGRPPGRAQGDPALVKEATRLLLDAQRPVMIAGSGIFWADAADELHNFVELARIPIQTRRLGRGAVPETHPLAFSGSHRRAMLSAADAIGVIGLRMSVLEKFGHPPTYPRDRRYVQISEAVEELSTRLPAMVSIVGNPKLVLSQMIDCAKSLRETPQRTEWLATVSKIKEDVLQGAQEEFRRLSSARPIDPNFLCQEIVSFLDPSATIILDCASGSGMITDRLQAQFAGQVLDTDIGGGVGHGIGMGIGVQLARPGKQVLSLLGDGGLGVGGMDIETAARYKLPVCYVIVNNDSWMGPEVQRMACPTVESWGMLPGIRYDEMFQRTGCYAELVTEPDQIRPALERAFQSGQTSVINVRVDKTVLSPLHRILAARVQAGQDPSRTSLY